MIKRLLWIVGIIVAMIVGLLATAYLVASSAMGTVPTDADQQRFASSPQFNSETRLFENRIPGLYEKMEARIDVMDALSRMSEAVGLTPDRPLPEVKPDWTQFLAPSEHIKVVWFGHSSFILNINGTIVLVDPVLSEYASPLPVFSKRFQPAIVQPQELPRIDVVVISHDHYDHLDMPTIEALVERDVQFLVPLGVSGHLRGWGVAPERIRQLDWWDSTSVGGLQFVCTPAQHFSGRDWINNNSTLWASWVIRSIDHSVYFSGDSGYDVHFKSIGEKYGPFDVAFLETGQYNKDWPEVHMLPEQGAQAYADLRAQRYFPVHWGMFTLAFHTWHDPIDHVYAYHQDGTINAMAPIIGQVVEVSDAYELDDWWTPVITQ